MTQAMHPIVEHAVRALSEDGWGGLVLTPAAKHALTEALDAWHERPDLPEAVRELMVFALYIGEEEGFVETARELFDVASTATPALERRATGDLEEIARAQKRAAELLATTPVKSAPRHGAAAPAGTVPMARLLSGLHGRRRG